MKMFLMDVVEDVFNWNFQIVIQLIFAIIIVIGVIGNSLEDPGCKQCQGSYCIFCSNNSYNRGLLDNIRVFFRTVIHSLLNLFGFHDTTDSHYNKDKHHHTKESVSHDVVTERLQEIMVPKHPRIDPHNCPYQIWVQDFPYHLCHAQHQAVVQCPDDVQKCEIRSKELAKHNGCPYHDELYGCSISPGKSCNSCSNKWKPNGNDN